MKTVLLAATAVAVLAAANPAPAMAEAIKPVTKWCNGTGHFLS